MLPVESKLTTFNTFIVSNFLYCPVVWHMCSKSNTKKVEKVKERALCFIYRKFESDYKSLLNLTELSSLYMDRLKAIVTEVYKTINSMSSDLLQDLFVIKANLHDLRDNNKMKFKTMTYGKDLIKYVAGILWNSINVDIKYTDNVNIFKRKIRNWQGPNCACVNCFYCLPCKLKIVLLSYSLSNVITHCDVTMNVLSNVTLFHH